jgi:hypothetical protein
MVVDLFPAVLDPKTESFVLLHTPNSKHKLFDLVYKVASTKTIYAIQTTTGKTHGSSSAHVAEFRQQMMDTAGVGWKLYLLYAVPSENFHYCETTPNNPMGSLRDKAGVKVMHVAIPNPTLTPGALLAQLKGSMNAHSD